MSRYSGFHVIANALTEQRWWRPAWPQPEPKASYDAIVIGGGGHGLATAYYLAKLHGMRNIAVLEKAYLGSGNVGRNTTIVRSNYMLDGNAQFYEWSLKLWEGLSQELNYNVMFSQRGVLNIANSPAQYDAFMRRGNAMRLNGIDAELLEPEEIRARIPNLDFSSNARWPVYGGLLQRRGGTARHDAVAWGYARAASQLGVDIIQHCEVEDFIWQGERIIGVHTNKGQIHSERIGMALAGNTTVLAAKAGLKLPIESHVLQAFVSEALKPIIDTVVTFGAGHFYISQSDKGGLVFGGDLDGYNSYAQRGNLPLIEHVAAAALALYPNLARVRIVRHWGGVMDMSMDGSPIISSTPVEGLYLNCGWCYGGFKATPASGWTFAHTIANGAPHQLNRKFTLDRFRNGYVIDEKGAGPVPGAH